jgi:cysteinyl-tRNA synthetase
VIQLHDSLTNSVRDLELRTEGAVTMYVCGPTVYDLPHLGHGRFTLVWDSLRRWLTFLGYEVTYVSNITDIDDNIIAKALREGRREGDVAHQYEEEWWRVMTSIGVAPPTHIPHATQWVDEMITLVARLLAAGKAYQTSDGVYLNVSTVPDYGALAGQPLDSLRAGARVEANSEKRSPLDFALWKNAKPDEPSWAAPFGDGRPGWHTECVVMSLGLLGDGFDLHCGGFDLRFPHHENERAQAVADGRVFARHWAHNGWVMVGGEKMSKSLGNFTSLSDLVAKTDPRAYRLLVLRSHYRSPIEVTPATIGDAERGLDRLDGLARRFDLPALAGSTFVVADQYRPLGAAASLLLEQVTAALTNDFDTPTALATIFEAVTAAHAAANGGDDATANDLAQTVALVLGGLGLTLAASTGEVGDDALALAHARDEARAAKEWATADEIRSTLTAMGYVVEDGPHGTVVRRA